MRINLGLTISQFRDGMRIYVGMRNESKISKAGMDTIIVGSKGVTMQKFMEAYAIL
jgi:hypothetical protein